MQEWEALQGISDLSHLTSLTLNKAARQLRGESPLSDNHLKLAATLTQLRHLKMSYCRVTDKGLAALAGLTQLEALTLIGRVQVRAF